MYWLLRGKRDSWLNLSKPVQVLNFEKLRGLNFVFVFFLTWKYMTNGRLNHRDQSKKDKRIMDRSDARARPPCLAFRCTHMCCGVSSTG
jgi:hypothetical protein